jgi:3-methylcrotonyl-CoA carboxylase alpha subunit
MTDFTRAFVCATAVRAAKAVDYVGAGTIEFIADGSSHLHPDRIWFMEMNTRLQVEHPVTEAITGVDLVEWQLLVAAGEQLPKKQHELSINGWAMEARLYAEDPAKGFLPSTGRLEYLAFPGSVRVETSVEEGDTISPFYDPMIAKLIAHGADRDDARMWLSAACGSTLCAPVKTNAWFLKRLLDHPEFANGDISTNFIPSDEEALIAAPEASPLLLQEAAEGLIFNGWTGPSEWHPRTRDRKLGLLGFRLNAAAETSVTIFRDNQPTRIAYDFSLYDRARNDEVSDGSMLDGNAATYFEDGAAFAFSRFAEVGRNVATGNGAILAPMPGRIIAVDVTPGQAVTKGQKLVTLEAMKMEHSLTAPFDGIVTELHATTGAQVQVEALLARIEPHPSP